MALQQDNALQSQPEYVTFALFFIVFGLAVIAAVLNLMLLKFMTMNTDDENRDEIEAIEVGLVNYDDTIEDVTGGEDDGEAGRGRDHGGDRE